jgi:vanillate O-demethylase monooxygenase subunit
MRLSLGEVVSDRLRCPYHGWTYDCQGRGASPGTPKLHARATHYDTIESHGVIWVKSAQSLPTFPQFDSEGYYYLGSLSHVVRAPVELVLDNFTEIEHTPTTHRLIGYDLDLMGEVKIEYQVSDACVRTISRGPARRMPWIFRLFLGIRNDFHFTSDWTVFFSPIYTVIDHYWKHPETGCEGNHRWRYYVFYVPRDAHQTVVWTFSYIKSSRPNLYLRSIRPILTGLLDREIKRDIFILENLADKSPRIEGMKLSRFDRGLALNRQRIGSIYRATDSAISSIPDQGCSPEHPQTQDR